MSPTSSRNSVPPSACSISAVRSVVNGARDELLAGARFAADEHGRVASRDFLDDLQDMLERAARADDPAKVVPGPVGRRRLLRLVGRLAELDGVSGLERHLCVLACSTVVIASLPRLP
jgi:hypothetical protein